MTQVSQLKLEEGSLLAIIEEMRVNLSTMVSQIKDGATTLSGACVSLVSQMQQINTVAQNSSSATGPAAAAIEEMTVSIGQISGYATHTERLPQKFPIWPVRVRCCQPFDDRNGVDFITSFNAFPIWWRAP